MQVAKQPGMEDRDVLGTSDSPDTEAENESIWQKVGSAVGLGGKKEKKEKPEIEGTDMKNLPVITGYLPYKTGCNISISN